MNFRGRGLIDGMDFRQLQEAASAAMLARQSSIYSLTFDELHSAMGGYVKDFGSMNMDEFLKSVWTAEESQAMETALRTPDQVGLQPQGSLTLPRTLSHKTVDEVWRGLRDCGTGGSEFQQQQTALGEITLEEFLVRAGVVREEMSRSVNTGIPSGVTASGVLYGDSMEGSGNNNTCPAPLGFLNVGRSAAGGMSSSTERRLYAAPPLALGSNGDLGCSQGMRGGGVNNGVISPMNRIPADGRNGDQSSLSPFPYVFNGGFSGKRANGAVEKTVERRQRRMIKNRESAARSRARKQAYTMELEAEVAQLKEENEELQKKQAEIMEMQRNQVIEMRNQQRRTKLCLRRTQTSPWYIKFDTFSPAAERGLPVTRVISRMTLQQILARAVGDDVIFNDSNVVDFVDDGKKVTVILENGQRHEGDLLVGADGIWSKVRKNLFGHSDPLYSGYTCYTGIADFVPPDIDTVGYRVFLGHKQYFVSSDVGAGKMQWYAFYNEPPGGSDVPNGKKERLLKIFNGWCDNVIDLINTTDEEAIIRRDIYDRIPIFTWGKGRVTLLGDSVHAMQPNMGQGGCMAIEDSYQLALELEKDWKESIQSRKLMDIMSPLKRYEKERRVRVAVIYGMARMAANMASTYRPYLGVGLGPLSFLTKYKIPHPGRVGGRFIIKYAMPLMLSWVLGGNSSKLEGRSQKCRLSDKASDQLQRWFEDDDALERALGGEWYLFPINSGDLQPIRLVRDDKRFYIIGSILHDDPEGTSIPLPLPQVDKAHARITCKDNFFYLTDLQSEHGTWITDNEGRRYQAPRNFPTRFHSSYVIEFGSDKKAVFRVKVVSTSHERQVGEQKVLQAA